MNYFYAYAHLFFRVDFQSDALYRFVYMTYICWELYILHIKGLSPLVSLAKGKICIFLNPGNSLEIWKKNPGFPVLPFRTGIGNPNHNVYTMYTFPS